MKLSLMFAEIFLVFLTSLLLKISMNLLQAADFVRIARGWLKKVRHLVCLVYPWIYFFDLYEFL